MNSYDAVIIGSGHNGLVAACYLAKAGKKILVLEKNSTLGGATASVRTFAGVDAKISRYSYLVSLLPDQIVTDLGLNFTTLSRKVSSYTPYFDDDGDKGLLINRDFDETSQASIAELAGNDEEAFAWQNFYGSVMEFAQVVAPTLLHPLPTKSEIQGLVDPLTWVELIENSLAQTLHDNFFDDLLKGVVLTDGLIGTFASAQEEAANVCFIYHLIGNGTGEWRVPLGGMGALVDELERRCRELGVEILPNHEAINIEVSGDYVQVKASTPEGEKKFTSTMTLVNCAPAVLEKISGLKAPSMRDGCQLKINMVVRELPQLKSGIDPCIAFAGTFHINESYFQLERAFEEAKAGKIPTEIPSEMYCHSLTDPSILGKSLQESGAHTLTLFALHLPASLFDKNHDVVKAEVVKRTLAGLNDYLVEPIENYLLRDSDGNPCIEAKTPQELELALGLPRGNIFHCDLQFPWKADGDTRKWGVETNEPRILLAGSGAVRGGAVSGIAGHNAAMAALESFSQLA